MESLKDKVAIVTGAARGMGYAIALAMAQAGAKIVISDIDQTIVNKAAKTLESSLDSNLESVIGIQADVTKEEDVEQLIDKTVERFGTIDILVNNAGILYPTRFHDISKKEWDFVMDVNINGVFLCSKAVIDIMRSKKYGRIINMSSSAGRSVSTLGGAHYTASKAAVLGLTRAVAKEAGSFDITVNAICPGLIATDMVKDSSTTEQIKDYENSFPINRLGEPKEVADLAVFLASDAAAYINGASIDINGGDLML